MTPPRIDAHLHLPPSGSAEEDLFITTQAAGVGIIALNSTCEDDWSKILNYAQRSTAVAPFLGIHPWWSNEVTKGWQDRLSTHLLNTRVSIGEIGLDSLTATSPETQEAIFIPQLEMAESLVRPVTIHCCRRWGRLLELLTATCKGRATVIIHGFSGSLEIMHRLLDLGAMLSFGPTLADPSRVKVRKAFEKAPLDRILLESDWPPRVSAGGNQSDTNQPPTPEMIIGDLYSVAAEIKAITIQQLQTMVWTNGQILTH